MTLKLTTPAAVAAALAGMLAKARAPEFESVFLDDQPALETRYGARVPVLRDEAGQRELDWPFDAATVQAWLAECDQVVPAAGRQPPDIR